MADVTAELIEQRTGLTTEQFAELAAGQKYSICTQLYDLIDREDELRAGLHPVTGQPFTERYRAGLQSTIKQARYFLAHDVREATKPEQTPAGSPTVKLRIA